jgi:hypothetical protein
VVGLVVRGLMCKVVDQGLKLQRKNNFFKYINHNFFSMRGHYFLAKSHIII